MRLFPHGAWFGLTRKGLRLGGCGFATLLVLCIVLFVGARIAQSLEYRRAALFLKELERIQPGQSQASVMPFILRYGGSRPDQVFGVKNDAYIIEIDPWHLMHSFPGPNWVELAHEETFSRLGKWRRRVYLRGWTVNASIRFADKRVSTVSGTLIIEGENEWLMSEWYHVTELPAYLRERHPKRNLPGAAPQYDASWAHLHFGDGTGEGIISFVTPLGTSEELNAAYSIDFQCLYSGRGCHSLCELIPDATRYRHEHGLGGWGWSSGSWGIQPHDCQ
jgi:hypothetical protein